MRTDEPKWKCQHCKTVVYVDRFARGFPPDAAKRKLVKQCKEQGHKCEPIYTAGYLLPPGPPPGYAGGAHPPVRHQGPWRPERDLPPMNITQDPRGDPPDPAVAPMNFGHHPNPVIDFCTEVDRIEGLRYECQVGMVDDRTLLDAVEKAMRFRVGGDVHAVAAKGRLREVEKWARRGSWT